MNILNNTEIKNKASLAQAELKNLKFPSKKEEDWKYTKISPLNPELYVQAEKHEVDQEIINRNKIEGLDSFKIVYIDGVFVPEFSNYPRDKFVVLPFSVALQNEFYKNIIEGKYGKLVPNEYFPVLNTTNVKEGTFIYVSKNTVEERPVEILYINTEQNQKAFQYLRNLFVVDDNSQIQITSKIQTFSNFDFLTNQVTEVFVGKNSNFSLYKIQNDSKTTHLLDSTYIEQERDSQASIYTFSLGGKVTRNELIFDQRGENINSILKGISLIGEGQEVGNHTLVNHNQPNCESHELYRGIYAQNAHGIFNGKIKVDQIAQKTNAFQQNNNVLLSNKASIDTKPQLEIFADDVKCSHGCTVGQLDNDALFYMKQRGIHENEAKALLMFAFCADVMETVAIPQLKDTVNKIVAKKLHADIDFDF